MNMFSFDLQRFDEVHREGNMIYGTAGDDNISNEDSNVEIHSGKGYDNINNSGSNVYISAGDGGANIFNTGNNVRAIAGSLPSAFISNSGSNCVLWGGSIKNTGDKTHLIGSPNDENFSNRGIGSTISASDGDDYIANTGISAVIYGESGKDTIVNFAEQVVIDSGGDGDVITNEGHHVKIYGGSTTIGNTITNYATDVYINGGSGSNEFHSSNDRVTIIAGDGDDTVDVTGGDDLDINVGHGKNNIQVHAGSRLKITGGDNANTIDVSGYKASIYSGKTASKISYQGSAAEIYTGAGKDTIRLISTGDRNSIHSGGGNDSILNGDKNTGVKGTNLASIYTAEGNDTVMNYKAKKVTINTGENKDYVENIDSDNEENVYSNIYTHTGDDKIINRNSRFAILDGGDGNDYFENDSSNVIILGGEDKDTVYNKRSNSDEAHYDIIDGGAGNDSIVNENSFVTISSGTGKDTVENEALNVTITASNANENIDPDATTTMQINNAVLVEATSGKDTICVEDKKVTIERNEDILTVKDTTGKLVIHAGADADSIKSINSNNVSIIGGSGENTIKNGSYVLDTVGYYQATPVTQVKEDEAGGNNVSIVGGDNNDFIQNYKGSKVTIETGDGNNQVSLRGGQEIIVNGGNKDDSFLTYENPNGNNTWNGSNLTINTGEGKNFVSVASSWRDVTVNGGNEKGVDIILNEGKNFLVKANGGNDFIKNSGDYATIFGGDDGDVIENYGNNVFIQGDNASDNSARAIGNYILTDLANDVTIDGGDNADTITSCHDVRGSICGGAGNDLINVQRLSAKDLENIGIGIFQEIFSALFSTILTMLGSSYVGAKSVLATLMNSAGNISTGVQICDVGKKIGNFLENFYSASTVNGGAGNDTVIGDGYAVRFFDYKKGDGNDVYYNFAKNKFVKSQDPSKGIISTLHITNNGFIEDVQVNGSDVLLKIGVGSIKLMDSAAKKFAYMDYKGKKTYRAYENKNGIVNSTIVGSLTQDAIEIFGTSGNDLIEFITDDNTIHCGAGNDTINCDGSNSTLEGGGGNDKIYTYSLSKDLTINGGTGDDTINADAKNVLIDYTDGDGNDIVHGFGSDDTLKISALSYTLERKGFDLIVHVGNGSINLKGCRLMSALGKVNIDGTPENDLVNVEFYDMQLDADKLSVLKLNPDEVVDVSDAPNEIRIIDASKSQTSVKIIGNSSVDKFIGSGKTDVFYTEPPASQNSSDIMYEMASNAFFTSNLLSADLAENESQIMTVIGGGGDDTIYGGEEKVKLYIYNANDGNDVINNFSASDTLSISENDYSTNKSGDDVIVHVGNGKITLVGAANLSTVHINDADVDDFEWQFSDNKAIYGTAKETLLTVNGVKTTDGIIVDTKQKTVTLKAANLNKKAVTISDGYTLKLANDVTIPTALAPAWTVKNTNATLHTDTSAGYTVENNKIVYSAKKTGDTQIALDGLIKNATLALPENKTLTLNASVLGANTSIESNASSYTIKLTGDMKGKVFVGTSGADTLSIAAKNASVKSGKGNDKLVGGAGNDSLNGGSGNDILSSGSGNDTLIGSTGNDSMNGGAGKDLFVFSAGNDTIADYTTGSDKISVSSSLGDAIFSVAENNVVLIYGENSLTILDGSDKVITFADNTKFIYTEDGRFNKDKTSITLSAATKTFYATNYSDLVTIDGSATSKLNITGNALANSILSGASNDKLYGKNGNDTLNGGAGNDTLSGSSGNDKLYGDAGNNILLGGKGNDSLWGGAGNDSLWGDAGKDTFIYTTNEGTDKIFDYSTGDLLKILNADGSNGSFKSSKYSGGDLTLTINDGGKIIFEDIVSSTKFNINGSSYNISGSKLVKK